MLKPGQDLEAIVAHAPEGARFLFEPGVYRNQTIRPKNRQEFIWQEGEILTGARAWQAGQIIPAFGHMPFCLNR